MKTKLYSKKTDLIIGTRIFIQSIFSSQQLANTVPLSRDTMHSRIGQCDPAKTTQGDEKLSEGNIGSYIRLISRKDIKKHSET